jgi:general stress protein 26
MTTLEMNGGAPVLGTKDQPDAVEVSLLLAGAAKTIGSAAEDSFANLRPMGRLNARRRRGRVDDPFITDGRSRKAADMRRASGVAIIVQREPDDAFVTLIGQATLCNDESEVRERWKDAYDPYFPSEPDRANAIFVKVDIERMELWIRGVTPEPFGLRATVLERDAGRGWRVISR